MECDQYVYYIFYDYYFLGIYYIYKCFINNPELQSHRIFIITAPMMYDILLGAYTMVGKLGIHTPLDIVSLKNLNTNIFCFYSRTKNCFTSKRFPNNNIEYVSVYTYQYTNLHIALVPRTKNKLHTTVHLTIQCTDNGGFSRLIRQMVS